MRTVSFQPIVGVVSQQVIVPITFNDDEVALEDDERLRFRLGNVANAILNAPSMIDVVVTDDDSELIVQLILNCLF